MGDALNISNINCVRNNGFNQLSAKVDGDYIYFSVPKEYELFPVAEPFVGIALLEAMISKREIVVDGAPVSSLLYKSLNEIQSIYSSWNSDLNIIDIKARTVTDNENYKHVGGYFSAGVDSSHTLLRHIDEITHLILFRSFDSGNDPASWELRKNKQIEFARKINKKIIPVDTNVRVWTESHKMSWEFVHGLFLSSVASIFGLKKIYIPSSHTYDELFPWGSHPLSDPLWSTESTLVVHDGCGFRRAKKMEEIVKNKLILNNLQVCWKYTHINCGECPKCARSIIAIHLLGAHTDSLPKYQNKKILKMIKANDESGATFLEDAMLLAKSSGDIDMYSKLRNYYRYYQLSLILPLIDRYLLGNFLRKIYRAIKKPNWISYRVSLRGAKRWDI